MEICLALTAAVISDMLLGDPALIYHPVRLMGIFIAKGETFCRKIIKNELLAGGVLFISTVCVFTLIILILICLIGYIGAFFGRKMLLIGAAQAFIMFRLIAAKSLKDESMRVYKYVKAGDIELSRKYIGYIVGRDTKALSFEKIIKAAVETVAENTSDGVIAPMFYFMIGGAPMAAAYKAINTMDSMIGYKNEKYLYFGRCAAKADDAVNFIPAIFSGLCMIIASYFLGLDYKNAYKIYKRDRHNHLSPNSAKTESVAAGALGIKLGGSSEYFGRTVEKPTIGDKLKEIEPDDIIAVNRLMYASELTALAMLCILRVFIIFLMGKAGI